MAFAYGGGVLFSRVLFVKNHSKVWLFCGNWVVGGRPKYPTWAWVKGLNGNIIELKSKEGGDEVLHVTHSLYCLILWFMLRLLTILIIAADSHLLHIVLCTLHNRLSDICWSNWNIFGVVWSYLLLQSMLLLRQLPWPKHSIFCSNINTKLYYRPIDVGLGRPCSSGLVKDYLWLATVVLGTIF